MEPQRIAEAAAFLFASVTAAVAAAATRRARRAGKPGADARAWTLVAMLFLALAFSRIVQGGPWLGAELRRLARATGMYQSRRPYQVASTVALAILASLAFAVGLRSLWEALKRYRMAASCIAVIVASTLIRFVSLHEIDAWNREWPWVRVAIDMSTSALAAAAALARIVELGRTRSTAR